jgi:hypothetical protein
VSDQLEKNYYSRCPPSLRPRHLLGDSQEQAECVADKEPDKMLEGFRATHRPCNALSPTGGPAVTIEASSFVEKTIVIPAGLKSWWNSKSSRAEVEHSHQESFASKIRSFRFLGKESTPRRAAKGDQGKLLVQADKNGVDRYYDTSLTMALLWSTWKRLLFAIFLSACNSVLSTTSSLLTKRVILHVTERYDWAKIRDTDRMSKGLVAPRAVGYGLGLAFGLAAMQMASALFFNHSFAQSADCGIMMRSAVMDQIARKSLRMSLKSRTEYTNGKQISAVVTDSNCVEKAYPSVVQAIIDPLTIVIGFVLLILNLGPSALVVSVIFRCPHRLVRTVHKIGSRHSSPQFAYSGDIIQEPNVRPPSTTQVRGSTNQANHGNASGDPSTQAICI